MRSAAWRGITTAEAALDDEDDAAQQAPVVDPRDAVHEREVRPGTPHLRRGEQERDGRDDTSVPFRITPTRAGASQLMGPQPSFPKSFVFWRQTPLAISSRILKAPQIS